MHFVVGHKRCWLPRNRPQWERASDHGSEPLPAHEQHQLDQGQAQLEFGFDGRKYISPQSFTQRVRGDYEYDALTEYLHDLAPTAFGERSTGNFFYYGDQTAFYGYGNDVWRITDKLSLNFGLRYEFTSVPVGERTQTLKRRQACRD